MCRFIYSCNNRNLQNFNFNWKKHWTQFDWFYFFIKNFVPLNYCFPILHRILFLKTNIKWITMEIVLYVRSQRPTVKVWRWMVALSARPNQTQSGKLSKLRHVVLSSPANGSLYIKATGYMLLWIMFLNVANVRMLCREKKTKSNKMEKITLVRHVMSRWLTDCVFCLIRLKMCWLRPSILQELIHSYRYTVNDTHTVLFLLPPALTHKCCFLSFVISSCFHRSTAALNITLCTCSPPR